MWLCMLVRACMEARGQVGSPLLSLLHLLSSEKDFSMILKLTSLASLAGQQAPGVPSAGAIGTFCWT